MKRTFLLTCLLLSALILLPLRGLAEPECTVECSYASNNADPDAAEFQPRGKRAYLRGDQLFVSSAALSELDFSKKGLAVVAARDHGWLYVRRNGSTIPTFMFDSFADRFVEGLARYTDHGKMGFINESGDIVIPARYGFACPFKDGYAVVCNGCHEVAYGEYHGMEGGLYGCINKKGKVVFRVKYSGVELNQKLQALDSRALD